MRIQKLMIIFLSCMLVSCEEAVVETEVESMTLWQEGVPYEVPITATGRWEASTMSQWLSLSPSSGDGDAVMTVTPSGWDADSKVYYRKGKITLTAKGSSDEINVEQYWYGIHAESDTIFFSKHVTLGGTWVYNYTEEPEWRSSIDPVYIDGEEVRVFTRYLSSRGGQGKSNADFWYDSASGVPSGTCATAHVTAGEHSDDIILMVL